MRGKAHKYLDICLEKVVAPDRPCYNAAIGNLVMILGLSVVRDAAAASI
jgi:hypothetical protein